MTRLINRLNVNKVRTATTSLCDGGGLYLQCSEAANGTVNRSWLFRYCIDGRERWMGLGSLSFVTLAEARERAAESRKLLFRGVDPLAHRNAQRAAIAAQNAKTVSFDEAAAQYVKSHQAGWRNDKHIKQWQSSLATYASPHIGKLSVQAIDTALMLKVLEPIWNEKPETARRIRGRIEAILDSAKARGLRNGENPARLKGNLDHLLAKGNGRGVEHHAALPYVEMPGLMADLRARDDLPSWALQFTILTAARTGETMAAKWAEIDAVNKLWIIPASRMKGGAEHRVPLSDPALAILNKVVAIRQNEYVFPGNRRQHLAEAAMRRALQKVRLNVTVHGLRSSFRDWAAEQTNFPSAVAELALAHSVGNAVEQAYRRSDLLDQRRSLMAAWAAFCHA